MGELKKKRTLELKKIVSTFLLEYAKFGLLGLRFILELLNPCKFFTWFRTKVWWMLILCALACFLELNLMLVLIGFEFDLRVLFNYVIAHLFLFCWSSFYLSCTSKNKSGPHIAEWQLNLLSILSRKLWFPFNSLNLYLPVTAERICLVTTQAKLPTYF